MAPKRKAAAKAEVAVEPPTKRTRGGKEEPKPKKEQKAAPAKKAPPVKAPARGKKAKVEVDIDAFATALLETCRVLMTVCETRMFEDEDSYTIVTEEDFKKHGQGLLDLLPEEARLPMMKIALMYQREMDEDPPIFFDEDFDDDEEEDAEEAEDDEGEEDEEDEEDEDQIMLPEHFFHFKKYFTEEEAATFVAGAADGGKLTNAVEEALESLCGVDADEEEDGLVEADEDDVEDEWTASDASIAWKKA